MPTTKTQIVSVFFVDIIGYSKQSVSDQVAIKRAFNAHLSAALIPILPEGRIVLDTGDGAAVAFLQAPEDALLTSDRLMVTAYGEGQPRLYGIRSGIHFGPAVIVNDVNGFGNLVGDAINDAQRVMSFAGDHEVFASRHYAEMVARISSSFADRFVTAGTSKDKHGRAHEVSRVLPVGYQPPAPTNVSKPVTTSPPSGFSYSAGQRPVAGATTDARVLPVQKIAWLSGLLVVAVAAWFFGLRTAVTTVPFVLTVGPAESVATPSSISANPAPMAAPSATVVEPTNSANSAPMAASLPVKEKPTKATPSVGKPPPVESSRVSLALTPAAKAKEILPDNELPCPQCSCPELLTKTSLGVGLNAAESRYFQSRCR